MRDRDVRLALHESLHRQHERDLDSTLFVDELGLCGTVRVDVAVVNGVLSGYELKSATDTLTRLPRQVSVYSQVLDYSTLVVAENHLDGAVKLLPAWWGCIVVRADRARLWLDEIRPASFSPAIEPLALAQLMWREETLATLESLGAATGFRSKPRRDLWQRLVDVTDLASLREIVRSTLKNRTSWRPAGPAIARTPDPAHA